jgi:hypothetical protein
LGFVETMKRMVYFGIDSVHWREDQMMMHLDVLEERVVRKWQHELQQLYNAISEQTNKGGTSVTEFAEKDSDLAKPFLRSLENCSVLTTEGKQAGI